MPPTPPAATPDDAESDDVDETSSDEWLSCAPTPCTPPVGTTQFVGCAIGGVSVGTVMKTIWPFYGALIFALGVVTFVPAFSTWLPSLFMVVK